MVGLSFPGQVLFNLQATRTSIVTHTAHPPKTDDKPCISCELKATHKDINGSVHPFDPIGMRGILPGMFEQGACQKHCTG